jgi:hypothetical protein
MNRLESGKTILTAWMVRMMVRTVRVFLIVLVLLTLPETTFAQEETPPAREGILVRGQILNRTTGEPAPEGLNLMLHVWDKAGSPMGMVHGVSGPEGVIEFEDVVVEKELFYVVMVTYQGATYYSDPVEAQQDGMLDPIDVGIYETTSNPTEVRADLFYLVFGFGQGGLTVSEIYGLSNLGERTVANTFTLEDGEGATFNVSLPMDAANLSFPSASPNRYVTSEGGFVDTQPLVPGVGSGQIRVNYILPYESEITFSRSLPFRADEINVYIPHESGVSMTVREAEYLGVEIIGEANVAYEVYRLGPLTEGELVEVTLSGAPLNVLTEETDQAFTKKVEPGVLIGGVVLGIALLIYGIWLWRRGEVVEPEEDMVENLSS